MTARPKRVRRSGDTVSVAMLRPFADLLGRLDEDGAAFLVALGVTDETAPDTGVAGDAVDALLGTIAARRRDPSFALTLARASTVRPLGLFGHVVWLSGTLRDALTRAVKYFSVVSRRTAVELDERGAIAIVRQRATSPRGPILTEYPFASLALRARAATGGRFAVRAVRFAHAGKPSAAYRDVFGAPVTFGADTDELELDAAMLALPLAAADPITSAALEAKAVQLAAPATLIDRVRRALAADLAIVSPAAIAKRLGISARTLRRHLEHDKQALRALADDVRRERADALLAAGTPHKDIAFQLGFSEPSAFSRAYKRWTGRTPGTRVKRLAARGHRRGARGGG